MKIKGVIPARYNSSRFPGKPLADICGKPMIWHVHQTAQKALEDVCVATDDMRIVEACSKFGIEAVMTSPDHRTGVDRLAEVANHFEADYFILIQGDEPLIEERVIRKMAEMCNAYAGCSDVLTFKMAIKNPIDAINSTVIKIVANEKNRVLFASRSPIPYPKESVDFTYYKSVGVYAYPRAVLLGYGELRSSIIETAEEHDFMRLLENEIPVRAFEIDTATISVDTPKDLERVRKIMLGISQN
ncbi:MAG: 3-deoxy-manno-octulosonate cytidylyltransferase [Clostridiales bacterium]|jgi:3-deoxy-manno-octulosonate cytidylyltransferase (CMP-KDO synthetase)|nr:3-deoxy-manno-octulosonate cytidylyltransferase [Clostridiales bacterium]